MDASALSDYLLLLRKLGIYLILKGANRFISNLNAVLYIGIDYFMLHSFRGFQIYYRKRDEAPYILFYLALTLVIIT